MSTTIRLMTAEELWQMPDDGMRHELVRGELRTMTPAGGEHCVIGVKLLIPLGTYVAANDLGAVFGADTGFIIARDPDTVRAPDVAFVRKERIPASGIPIKFWSGAPDLAVEVVSPGDTVSEVEEKVHQWLAAGTALVWVVNPRRRTVTVYCSPSAATILTADQVLDGGDVVPGFRLPIANVFA